MPISADAVRPRTFKHAGAIAHARRETGGGATSPRGISHKITYAHGGHVHVRHGVGQGRGRRVILLLLACVLLGAIARFLVSSSAFASGRHVHVHERSRSLPPPVVPPVLEEHHGAPPPPRSFYFAKAVEEVGASLGLGRVAAAPAAPKRPLPPKPETSMHEEATEEAEAAEAAARRPVAPQQLQQPQPSPRVPGEEGDCFRELCCHPPMRALHVASARVPNDDGGLHAAQQQQGGSRAEPTLVLRRRGTVPVLVTAGHGAMRGRWQKKMLRLRKAPKNTHPGRERLRKGRKKLDTTNSSHAPQSFQAVVDTGSNEIALELAALLPLVTHSDVCGGGNGGGWGFEGGKQQRQRIVPYVVVARFHRSYVDVNRPLPGSPYCCPTGGTMCDAIPADAAPPGSGEPPSAKIARARRLYDGFHAAIGDAVSEIRRRWPGQRVLHLDLHAQANRRDIPNLGVRARDAPETVFIGTARGNSVASKAAVWAPGGFVGQMRRHFAAAGYARAVVHPPTADVGEHPAYPGGFIATTWGHALTGVTDSLQLEFGRSMRFKRRGATVRALAGALACYWALRAGDAHSAGDAAAATTEDHDDATGTCCLVDEDASHGARMSQLYYKAVQSMNNDDLSFVATNEAK